MKIRCGVKVNGERRMVRRDCNCDCPFYGECLKELGIRKPKTEFMELDPTDEELEAGAGHLNEKGEIKIWKKVKI